jgi:hypothetical protein
MRQMLHLRNRKVQQYNVVRKKTGSNDCQEKILCSGDTTGSNGIVKGKKIMAEEEHVVHRQRQFLRSTLCLNIERRVKRR